MKFNDVFHRPYRGGEIGIEIEVEGKNLPGRIGKGWSVTNDGSLRGEENREFIFSNPVSRKRFESLLFTLDSVMKETGARVDYSERTSVHVHINAQDMTITQTFNFILLYLLLEEPLMHFCGESREGNLFCLRHKDAEYLINILEDVAEGGNFRNLDTSKIRYASLNLSAIAKYGSLEFRGMRGTDDMEVIIRWVNILLRLKDMAKEFKSPIEIIESFSILGVEGFVLKVFGPFAHIVFAFNDWEHSIILAMRKMQIVAYNGDWQAFDFIDEPEEDI